MQSIRVASFNAENLNRPGVFYAGRPNDGTYDQESFDAKCAWIGSILDEGRVDLVGFQEIFSHEALQAAVARSRHLGSSPMISVLSPETEGRRNEIQGESGRVEASGPHVGLATSLEVLSAESIADFPASVRLDVPLGLGVGTGGSVVALPISRFERPVLRARVVLPGGMPATVLVAHLKSKRPKFIAGENQDDPMVRALGNTRSLIVRAAEAVALRALVLSIIDDSQDGRRGEPLIVLGDLNDDLPSVTTQTVAGEEPPAVWGRERKQRLWDVQLYSVHDIQEGQSYRDVSYTHVFNGRYELLDHIFVSQEFVRQFSERVAEVRGTRIFNDHIFDGRLAIRPDRPAGPPGNLLRLPTIRSDHGIPVTEIALVASGHSQQAAEGQVAP